VIKPILKIQNLTVSFTSSLFFGEKIILQDISFTVYPGECIAVIGHNGSGKTTLLKAICGLMVQKTGTITTDKEKIGYVPERYHGPSFLTAENFMWYIGRLLNMPNRILQKKIEQLFSQFNLQAYRHEKVANLSKGTAQRLYIVQALLNDPQLLLLDEPFSGLDTQSASNLNSFLAQQVSQGTAIVCAIHNQKQINFDRIIKI